MGGKMSNQEHDELESSIYAIKTTANQERAVANLLALTAKKENYDIRAILVPKELKGYVLIETNAFETVEQAIQGLSLIHISEPTRLLSSSYAVFCLKKTNTKTPPTE